MRSILDCDLKSKVLRVYLSSLLLFLYSYSFAQTDSLLDIGGLFTLDSIVVVATRNGLDVDMMIRKMQQDESFYQAFRNTRYMSYTSQNKARFYNKHGKVIARQENEMVQSRENDCSSQTITYNKIEGNLMKRNDYRHFTSKMFDQLFYFDGKKCGSPTAKSYLEETPNGRMELYERELKRLIFNPGSPVDLPFLGKKTDIFSPEMRPFYTYQLYNAMYEDISCYVMDIEVKPAYKNDPNQTVIRSLVTYFNQEDFSIVKRKYHLEYQNMLFSFDVKMDIDVTLKASDTYVPKELTYDGTFKAPTKRRETAIFNSRFQYD